MLISILIYILSAVAAASIYLFTPIQNNLWNLFFIPLIYIGFVIVLTFIALLTFFIIGGKPDLEKEYKEPNKFYLWGLRQILGILMYILMRIHTKVDGLELIPKNEKCLFVVNHFSAFDHLCLIVKFPSLSTVSISKPENEKKFFSGNYQHKAGFIPINRDNPLLAVKAILKAAGHIKENKYSILVSPEGTRSLDGKVHEFHPACFKIADKTHCPVVLISSYGTDTLKKRFKTRLVTGVHFKVNKVLYYNDYKDMTMDELTVYSKTVIENGVNELKNK